LERSELGSSKEGTLPEPVNGAGFRPRDVPPLVRAMYSDDFASAMQALSLTDLQRESLINVFGWDGVQRATNGSAWVHAVFNRYEAGDNQFPTHASMRAQRAFEGSTLVAPTSYFDDVSLGDWPSGFTPGERDSGRYVAAGNPILVSLPLSGPPVVARQYIPLLATARERGQFEVAVRVKYV
jgi:hypothetical protein